MTPEPGDDGEQAGRPDASGRDADGAELPAAVVDEAERLTRHAREAVDDAERAAARRRRDDLLAAHGYTARLRDEDETLVCYPTDWLDDDGRVDVSRVDDTSRGVERPLESPAADADWDAVERHNAALVERIREMHGDVHAANARAFADFMGNHYARRVDEATPAMREEFLTDYYPRNAWPSAAERAAVEESIALLLAEASENTEE